MKLLLLTLAQVGFVNAAFAQGQTTRTLHLKSIESRYACAQKKLRSPDATCSPQIKVITEDVVLKLKPNHAGRSFELTSECRSLKGDLREKNASLTVVAKQHRESCPGRELTLSHEAAFHYMRQVSRFVDLGDGRVMAEVSANISLIFEAQDQMVAAK